MGFTVKEVLSEGKKGDPLLNEDLYVSSDRFVAVIDGATSVSGKMIAGQTPGRFAAEIIKQTIEGLAAEASLEMMVSQINVNLQYAYLKYDLLNEIEEKKWMAPSACLVIYSDYYHEVWQIGDCQLMIDGQVYSNDKELDNITANARSLFLEAEIKKGKTIDELIEHDTGWEFIRTLIQQQYFLQNDSDNQYGYDVINGFNVDFTRVKTIKIPVDAKEIILASDGYPFLKDTLEESEYVLSKLIKEDPLCFRIYKSAKGLIKGNKSFDDRTYVKLEMSGT
ncbi:hypothetical protein GH741_01740 [Aquibacillus halophilus]|uniref:Protein phosphatase 2C domain-containing protein n=1 Tax=Aquibacillus halophilus TaxID=930132 RepID=A0A6A8D6L8_9BACI|nr:hypothetical protein [Aquibacillus halophilus]MRH41393.1 hypothetical protein [Aquibacillus halophilus]